MRTISKIAIHTASVLLIATTLACTDKEQGSTPLAQPEENISFFGAVEDGQDVATRATTPMNSTKDNYGDIYIYQKVNDEEENIQIYTVSSGQQGRLETKNEGEPLKWESANAEHTFYAWTQPYPGSDEEPAEEPTEQSGGVIMDKPTAPATYATTGKVTFGTQKETNLERFIVAKVGPLSYSEQNQYVGLHFYHPVARIVMDSVTHVRADGSFEDIDEATITFPNLPKNAELKVLSATDVPYTDVLDASESEKGITWTWEKGDSDARLYVYPFKFKEEGKADYEQPGYFTIKINVTTSGSSSATTEKVYSGTLALSQDPTEVKGNECLHIGMQVADGSVTGIYSYIKDWNTVGNQDVYQHRVPGIYTQANAEALLNGLLKEPINIPEYLLDGKEDDEVRTIRFFTHVDWSSLLEGEEVESITIPEGYILDGQGYNLILPKDFPLYGTTDNEEENIKNLYLNGKEYTFAENVPELPDEDTEDEEETTGGGENEGTTPSETPEPDNESSTENNANA